MKTMRKFARYAGPGCLTTLLVLSGWKPNPLAAKPIPHSLVSDLALAQTLHVSDPWLLGSLSFLSCIILILLINQHQLKKKIEHQRATIRDQHLDQQQLQAMRALFSRQEKARSQVAHELYEKLGVLLASLKFHLNGLDLPHNQDPFKSIDHTLGQAISEIRRIARESSNMSLSKLGMSPALSDLCQGLTSTHGTPVHFYSSGETLALTDFVRTWLFKTIEDFLVHLAEWEPVNELYLELISDPESGCLHLSVEAGIPHYQQGLWEEEFAPYLPELFARLRVLLGQWQYTEEPGEGLSFFLDFAISPPNTPTTPAVSPRLSPSDTL